MFDKLGSTLGTQHIVTMAHTEIQIKLEFRVPVIKLSKKGLASLSYIDFFV